MAQSLLTNQDREVITPSYKQSLLPPPSPALPSLPPTPHRTLPYQTSTPVRKSAIPYQNKSLPLTPHHPTLPSPTIKPLLSPGGDCPQPTPLLPLPDQAAVMNTTSGSTAFSADGSFMEI
eukprot:GFUD01111289.1.p1 GENE.GFUD01111289.1~~GFUD01111289.1.p1  ORF type:complete len:132 (-),score=45.21 GFUD01111289.1:176-535(-)